MHRSRSRLETSPKASFHTTWAAFTRGVSSRHRDGQLQGCYSSGLICIAGSDSSKDCREVTNVRSIKAVIRNWARILK